MKKVKTHLKELALDLNELEDELNVTPNVDTIKLRSRISRYRTLIRKLQRELNALEEPLDISVILSRLESYDINQASVWAATTFNSSYLFSLSETQAYELCTTLIKWFTDKQLDAPTNLWSQFIKGEIKNDQTDI